MSTYDFKSQKLRRNMFVVILKLGLKKSAVSDFFRNKMHQ